jgi:nucleoside 2-deoxyribosyltransferase
MSKPKVYLAGIISGLNYKDASDWREYAKKELETRGIIGVSPMRWKDSLKNEDILVPEGYDKHVMSTPEGIITRDRWDVENCDILLVNLTQNHAGSGDNGVSIGSTMEIAWANLLRKPVVAIAPKDNVHIKHCMFNQCVNYRVDTLEESLAVCEKILLY